MLSAAATAVLLTATNFLVVFDGLVVTVALPAIQGELRLGHFDTQWVVTSYSLPLGGMLLLGGRCGDRYGLRRALVTGLCLFAAGLVLAGVAAAGWMMFTGRALQGAGAALAVPATFAVISAVAPPVRRRRLFAAVAVAGGVGAASGAVVGGLVTQGLGWRYVFLLTVPVAVAAAGAAAVLLRPACPARAAQAGQKLDGIAALLSVSGLLCLVFAVTNVARAGVAAAATLVSFALAAVLLAAFVVRERCAETPLLRPGLLRSPSLRACVAGMPGQEFAYQGTVFIGLLYLQQVLGYRPVMAGLAFSPLGITVLLGSPVAGLLLRRYHWTTVIAGTQLVCAAGLLLLSAASPSTAYLLGVFPGLVLLGLANTVSAVTFNVAAGREIPVQDKGAAYGLYETSKYLAGTFAVASLATLAAARAGSAGQSGLAGGYRVAFTAAAAVALIGGAVTLALGRRPPAETTGGGTAVAAHADDGREKG